MGVNKKQKKVSIINTLKIDDKGNADRAPRLGGQSGEGSVLCGLQSPE